MEKKINRISGNIFYKILLYILIAITAAGAAFCIGISIQGDYYGTTSLSSDKKINDNKELYIKNVINCESSEIFEMIYDWCNDEIGDVTKYVSYEDLKANDMDFDGDVDSRDVVLKIKSQKLEMEKDYYASLSKYISEKYIKSVADKYISYDVNISIDDYDVLTYSSGNISNEQKSDGTHFTSLLSTGTHGLSRINYEIFDDSDAADAFLEECENEYGYCNIYEVDRNINKFIARAGVGNDNYLEINLTVWVDNSLVDDGTVVDQEVWRTIEGNAKRWDREGDLYLILSVVFGLACFVLIIISMIHCGRKTGEETIKINIWEKTPSEVFLIGLIIGCAVLVLIMDLCKEIILGLIEYDAYSGLMTSWTYNFASDRVEYWILCGGLGITSTVMLIFFNTLVVKAKSKTLIKNSITGCLFKGIFGKDSKVRKAFRYTMKNINFMAKAICAYIIIVLAGGICLISFYNDPGWGMFLFFVLGIILTVIYFGTSVYLYELYKGGKKLANGELEEKVNTNKMLGVFKEHGENLNSINDGIAYAVEDRLKSERMKTELITNVSHDIKTPLTSIINYVDLLQKEGLSGEPEAGYIEVLARQSNKLKKLIEDLVEASKASTGNIQMNLEAMDVNMIISQAAGEYLEKYEKQNLMLIVKGTPEEAIVNADGRYLWRVFDNLLNNALKYSMPGSRVYVDVVRIDGIVKVCFKNTSKEQLNISADELMERFVRGDSSRNTEGSGLGLSIANSLCSLMGVNFSLNIDGDLFKVEIEFP